MFNIDRMHFDFECPRCKFMINVFFRDARLRDVLICRGCKANIQLDDYMNECRKARREIDAACRELEKALSGLNSTITIRF